MKYILLILSVFIINVFADVWVNGYTKSNGTYVEGHHRSSPNDTKSDNWSTYGNTNPYTGEDGTRRYDDYNNYGRSSNTQENYTYEDYEQDGGDAQYAYSRQINNNTNIKEEEKSIWLYLFVGFIFASIVFTMYSSAIGGIYKFFTKKEYDVSDTEMYVIFGFSLILMLVMFFK